MSDRSTKIKANLLDDLLNVKNTATEETLNSIKSTDGIKKITDALPAGTNTIGSVKIVNGGPNIANIDDNASALVSIDHSHHEIHEGDSFRTCIGDQTMASNDQVNIIFTTPDTTKQIHIIWQASCQTKGIFNILENPTTTANTGTVQAPYNRNRNSLGTSTVYDIATTPAQGSVTANGTITNDGTTICQWLLLGGNKLGGGSRDAEEFILKRNTKYAFRLTALENTSAGALSLDWYEHTPNV